MECNWTQVPSQHVSVLCLTSNFFVFILPNINANFNTNTNIKNKLLAFPFQYMILIISNFKTNLFNLLPISTNINQCQFKHHLGRSLSQTLNSFQAFHDFCWGQQLLYNSSLKKDQGPIKFELNYFTWLTVLALLSIVAGSPRNLSIVVGSP